MLKVSPFLYEPVLRISIISAEGQNMPRFFVAKNTFGSILLKLKSDFDPRQYGFKKLSEFVKGRSDLFEIQERKQANSESIALYLRPKK